MSYRIVRYKYGWILEHFQAAGGKISRGKYAGREKGARWAVVGYYLTVEQACTGLLDKAIGDIADKQEATNLLEAIAEAKACILQHLSTEGFVIATVPE